MAETQQGTSLTATQVRDAWNTFCTLAEKARKEGISVYMDNTRHLQNRDMFSGYQIIHITEQDVDLSITKTIRY